MKFLLTWKFEPGTIHAALAKFSEMTAADDLADHGEEVKLIGRWHDLPNCSGVAVVESQSASALANWALNWNAVTDLDFSPVLDDEETRALGKARNDS